MVSLSKDDMASLARFVDGFSCAAARAAAVVAPELGTLALPKIGAGGALSSEVLLESLIVSRNFFG